MSFILKNIEMTLDEASIENAIREVELFQKQFKPAMECLIRYLAEKGVEIARAELLFFDDPAYDTGALSESVKYELLGGGDATVSAGEGLTNAMGEPVNYAIFVEFGTGVFGADVNNHGASGWFYPDPAGIYEGHDGRTYSFTKGLYPRPFMQNTLNDLADEAEVAGGRVIAEYIRGERA